MDSGRNTRRFTFVILLCGAALLRILAAVQPGLWADEIFSLAMATGHSLEHPAVDANPALGDFIEPEEAQPAAAFRRYLEHETPPLGAERVIRAVSLSDTSPPLYYVLLNAWTRAAGTSDVAVRLFSTLWALACLPLLWTLGRAIGGSTTAWTSCMLFAFTPPAIYYAAEGRMYSLLWCLGLSLVWSTLQLNRRGPSPYSLVLWVLSGAAGLLSHYFFAFFWLACLAWLWLYPGRTLRLHVGGVVALTAFLALLWYIQIPDGLNRWRITGTWLADPLSWQQVLTAPFILAWSLLSGRGPWGGLGSADRCAAALYAVLALAIVRRGAWRLLSRQRQLLWLCLLGVIIGPVVFDVFMHTHASTIWRYALPGLPVAALLAALGVSTLPVRARVAWLTMLLLALLPGIQDILAEPARRWEPYPDIADHLAAWATPSDLIIVHSIPSGVLGVARYLDGNTPLASWVVQLGQRRVPEDMEALAGNRCRVALVKVHDLGAPSPAEAWLREHMALARRVPVALLAEILYFRPRPSERLCANPPASRRK